MDDHTKAAKPHQKHLTGRKAQKRKLRIQNEKGDNVPQLNPKAFAIQRVNKLNRSFRQ